MPDTNYRRARLYGGAVVCANLIGFVLALLTMVVWGQLWCAGGIAAVVLALSILLNLQKYRLMKPLYAVTPLRVVVVDSCLMALGYALILASNGKGYGNPASVLALLSLLPLVMTNRALRAESVPDGSAKRSGRALVLLTAGIVAVGIVGSCVYDRCTFYPIVSDQAKSALSIASLSEHYDRLADFGYTIERQDRQVVLSNANNDLYRKDGTMLQCTITLTDNASQGDGYDIDEAAGVMLWNENGIVSPVYTRRVTITSDGGTKIEFVEDSPAKKSDHISNALTQIMSAVK